MSEIVYANTLTEDMPWQFRHKDNIEVLIQAIAHQLQDVYDFFTDLDINRRIDNAEGVQLDRIGDIVCLSRAQAGLLTGSPITVPVLNDETYRKYLKYKILLNTSSCTYKDLMNGFSLFLDDTVYYREDLDKPATIVLKGSNDVTSILASMPITRAAGVGVFIEENIQKSEQVFTPYFGTFYEDTVTVRWSTDEMKTHMEGDTLVTSAFRSDVYEGVFHAEEGVHEDNGVVVFPTE